MAKAKQLPSGSWRVLVYIGKDKNGKRQYKSVTANTKKEAEYQALQIQLKYTAIAKDSAQMTLNDAMKTYIEEHNGLLSPTTARAYDSILRCQLQSLQNVRLVNIDRRKIQVAINEASKTLAPKTVKNIYGFLSVTLNAYHPTLGKELSENPIKMPQKVKFHAKTLTPEQVSVLLNHIKGTHKEFQILCGIWLCMRESEVVGLRWEDIDFDSGVMHISHALVESGTKRETMKTTKQTESDRFVKLPTYILDLLREMKKTSTSDRIVPICGNTVYRNLRRALKACGLPQVRFHDLRHSNTSIMALIGVPQYLAQRRGGWSTPETMNRVYTHQISINNPGDTMVNEYFDKLLNGESGGEIQHEMQHDGK